MNFANIGEKNSPLLMYFKITPKQPTPKQPPHFRYASLFKQFTDKININPVQE